MLRGHFLPSNPLPFIKRNLHICSLEIYCSKFIIVAKICANNLLRYITYNWLNNTLCVCHYDATCKHSEQWRSFVFTSLVKYTCALPQQFLIAIWNCIMSYEAASSTLIRFVLDEFQKYACVYFKNRNLMYL